MVQNIVWMDGWVDGWIFGRMDVWIGGLKAILRIAYSKKKAGKVEHLPRN